MEHKSPDKIIISSCRQKIKLFLGIFDFASGLDIEGFSSVATFFSPIVVVFKRMQLDTEGVLEF